MNETDPSRVGDTPRLIEFAFPLKQASLDSVHEKNVRHGHISTLHIWPARRPLAACRAALIATLLPDPGDPKKRQELCEKIGGKVVQGIEKKKMPGGKVVDRIKEETIGGILHWGRESENKATLDWFREEIRKAYGGRAPKVLDPFAGGGAIPLEAMRLGCEVTALDINPVAWFILKCTLEYPQKLAGQKRPLPEFILKDREFMEAFLEAQGLKGTTLKTQLRKLGLEKSEEDAPLLKGLEPEDPLLEADLAWHVRAWGKWVLNEARKDLAKYYPTYADFEPLKTTTRKKKLDQREPKLCPLKPDGTLDLKKLNKEFSKDYLDDPENPRWLPKPAVAYLWARTVTCKNCRAVIPLLKTRWLCKKDNRRVLLSMTPTHKKDGVEFGIEKDVPVKGGNAAQKREHDRRLGAGTMSRSGASCPCCAQIMDQNDIQFEGKAGRLGTVLTAVSIATDSGRDFRLPTLHELRLSVEAESCIAELYSSIPHGVPTDSIVEDAKRNTWCVQYGVDTFAKLFTARQLCAIGTLVKHTHATSGQIAENGPSEWREAIAAYLAAGLDRLIDRCSTVCRPDPSPTQSGVINTFSRFALPLTWDFVEGAPFQNSSGGYIHSLEWVAMVCEALCSAGLREKPTVHCGSVLGSTEAGFDVLVTDPPYYDAIGYSVLMDFFYVWLRRVTPAISDVHREAFRNALAPKWDAKSSDGELIDDASRFGGDRAKSKAAYEEGMFRAFKVSHAALAPNGRFVIVFAHKEADAWETLASAIVRAGFVVDGSWPIQTEMGNRSRALASAALSSSVWLVCKKRAQDARPGWDNKVLDEMRASISSKMQEFWDAGIRGPDFVWAATGPAMEAYSKHPVVKIANEPNKLLDVSDFLKHVRRMVIDYVVGRVLSHNGHAEDASMLDDPTAYYLLHRHDFGVGDAPAGPCILYATSCGLTDGELADQFDILARVGGKDSTTEDTEDAEEVVEEDEEEGTGSKLKLKAWNQRKRPGMGYDPSVDSARARADRIQMKLLPEPDDKTKSRREIPLIDQIHRLMHLWKEGDLPKVNDYLDIRGLHRNRLFLQVLQAIIELAPAGSEERSILEAISNHIAATRGTGQLVMEKVSEYPDPGSAKDEHE